MKTAESQIEYFFYKPRQVPESRLDEIEKLIISGGKIVPDWVRYHLERAYLLAYALDGDIMAGTETLKTPRPEYIAKVRDMTGVDLTGYVERGYIVVLPEYRRMNLGMKLVDGCLARSTEKKNYLSIGMDNTPGQELTKRYGSILIASYYSEKLGKDIGIWMPKDQEPDFV